MVSECIFHTNGLSITQQQMTPKCSNLVWGMTLGCPTSDMVMGLKVKVRVSSSNMAWVQTMSALLLSS